VLTIGGYITNMSPKAQNGVVYV